MAGSPIDLIIATLALGLQAFFAGAETALITIDHFRIKALKSRYRWAQRVEYFQRNPEAFFSSILIGEDIALVVMTTFFTRFIIATFGSIGTFYSVAIISIISLIFAQIIPKGLALNRGLDFLAHGVYPIYDLSLLLRPVILVIRKVTAVFLKLYPKEEFTHLLAHEIVEGFRDARSYGHLSRKADRIAERLNIVRRRTVKEVMIPIERAVTIKSPEELTSVFGDHIYSRIPVIRDGQILGVINVKEYIYTGKVELREPLIVDAETPILTLLRILKGSGEQLAIVVEQNRPVGIVSLEDLIEELVGEIEEEL